MAKIYLHKQTIAIALVCLVAVVATAAYVYQKPSSLTLKNAADQGLNPAVYIASTSQDNGTWRSQFISSTTNSYAKNGTTGTSSKTTNITENISMDFLSSFAQLKQANLISNTDAVNQVTNNIISADLGSITAKTYTENDLKIVLTSPTTLNSYNTSVSSLINSYSPSTTTSEFAIIQEFIANNDPTVLSSILPILKEQKRILAGLLFTPVPQMLAENHLKLINGFSSIISASELLQVTDTDPIKSLAGSSLHVSGAQNITDALSAINKLLESSGVKFNLHWEILNSLLN